MNNLHDDSNLPDEGVQLIEIRCAGRHHRFRSMVLSWNEDGKELERNIRRAFNITEDYDMERERLEMFEMFVSDLQLSSHIGFRIHYAPRFVPIGGDTVQIKVLTGKTLTIQGLDLNVNTLFDLMCAIRDATAVPAYVQRIIYKGRQLEEKTLKDSGIPNGAVLHLALRLRGGFGSLFNVELPTAIVIWPRRVFPSRPKNLLRLHYGERKMLSLWNSNFTAFTSNARQQLGIPPERVVYFHVTLEIFGDDKMEVDPGTWPALKGSVSDIWISDTVPFTSNPVPVPSEIGQVRANSGGIASETQQARSTLERTLEILQ